MKRAVLVLTAGALAGLLTACGSGIAGRGTGAGVAARVGPKTVGTTELTELVERGLKDPDFKSNLPDQAVFQRNVLTRLITRLLNDEAAKRLGVTLTDAEVEKRYQQFAQEAQGVANLEKQAAQNGIAKEDVRTVVRDFVMTEKLGTKLVSAKPVTAAAIKAEYEKNKAQYDQVKLQHILVKDEKLANDILAKLRAGQDFAALAKQYSTDPGSKDNGGIYDFAPRGQYVKPFEDAAFATQPGQLVGPVKTDFGFHVIKVLERKITTLAQATPQLKTQLEQAAQQDALPNYLKELATELGISVNPRFGRWDADAQEVVATEEELSSPAPSDDTVVQEPESPDPGPSIGDQGGAISTSPAPSASH